jgi:hypothetical protein
MPLQSKLFADDPRLQACLELDSAHVLTGAVGTHVSKIQAALLTLDGAKIAETELANLQYGPSTARAVLEYKQKREIINRSYQDQADDIVGKMTIDRMDKELIKQNTGPVPRVMPEMPLPTPPSYPEDLLKPPAGFRLSGWKISDISGFTASVPIPIPGLSVTAGYQKMSLAQTRTGRQAKFLLRGGGVSIGLKELTDKIPFLKGIIDALKSRQLQLGVDWLPSFASEVLLTPWVNEPVEPAAFDGYVALISLSGTAGVQAGAGLVIFSMLPMVAVPGIAEATIKGVAITAGMSLTFPPGLGLGGDSLHFLCTLDP